VRPHCLSKIKPLLKEYFHAINQRFAPVPEISPATFEALATLVNLSSAELSDHLDLTVAMLLAYEGADISAEIQAISTLVLSVRQKLEAHSGKNQTSQKE
jgi:hypothetical protein